MSNTNGSHHSFPRRQLYIDVLKHLQPLELQNNKGIRVDVTVHVYNEDIMMRDNRTGLD